MTDALENTAPAQARWGGDRALLAPKAFYFCFYAASSGLLPFLTLYYRDLGLSGAQIGLLVGISPIITLLAAPLWGALADSTRRHRTILTATIVGAMGMVALLSQARALLWLLPIVVGYAFFAAPIMPLVDNGVMEMLGERRELYGRQRVWGAIGWGLSALVAGALIDRYGLGLSFYIFIFFFLILLAVTTRLTVSTGSMGQPYWQGVRHLANNRPLLVFLLTVLFAGIGSGIVHNYVFLYLLDLGANETLMGLSQTVATLSEMPVFFFSAILLRKFGARGMLLMALAAYVVRLLAYTLLPPVWLVLPINLLHGLTFSALWVAGVSYASEVAPKGMGATAQGLFTGVTMGLGTAGGALLGGTLYDTLGPTMMFRVAALLVLAGLIFFAMVGRVRTAEIQERM
jgi:MFS transporter, PPP family, 3-phenylpropionic acid transporter